MTLTTATHTIEILLESRPVVRFSGIKPNPAWLGRSRRVSG